MLEKTLISTLALALFVSCASANAKQPPTFQPIENLATTKAGQIPALDGDNAGLDISEGYATGVMGGTARQHGGAVRSLARIPGTDSFFSGDEEGFATLHNSGGSESWQLSDLPLLRIAANPDGSLVAVYESDGYTVHRVSVWDWSAKRRLYAKRFKDSVLSLSWSAKGTWLMVGNSSLDGITVLSGITGEPVSLFATQPGMVSFAVTGKSETSVMTFGPSGRLLYTDTANGAPRADYTAVSGVSSPVLLNNGRAIAGLIDGNIGILDATSGKTLRIYETSNSPRLLTGEDGSEQPLWLEYDQDSGWTIHAGDNTGGPFSFPEEDDPTASVLVGDRLLIGTKSGIIYELPAIPEYGISPRISAVDSYPFRRIDDAVSDSARLFILSDGALLVSAGPGTAPLFAFDGIDADRVSLDEGSLVFWSDKRVVPVIRSSLDGDVREVIYVPSEPLSALNAGNEKTALIEAYAKVVVLSDDGGDPFTYRGIGLQDVLCLPGPAVIVTKSATSRAPNPVIKIDIRTGETVPFNIPGNLFYGIRAIDSQTGSFSGFLVTDGESGPSTRLVTVSSLEASAGTTPLVRTDASYADEDLAASAASDGDARYTNLGKGSIVRIDAGRGSVSRYPRGYALPKRIVLTDRSVVSINHDGSLTWISRDSGMIEATASITGDGYWKEE